MTEWFDGMLFPPNIAILDYIIKNIKFFSGKRIIDNGTGIGILPIFIDKLGIDCLGYDNGDQVNDKYDELVYNYNKMFKKNILLTQNIPKTTDHDVVTSSGIWVDDITTAKMYILDARWVAKCFPDLKVSYEKKCEYPELIEIYKKT